MKIIKKTVFIAIIAVIEFSLVSCQDYDTTVENTSISEANDGLVQTRSGNNCDYTVIGREFSNESPSISIDGNCGHNNGGVITSYTEQYSSCQFSINISKKQIFSWQNNSNYFSEKGNAYIKNGSVCGPIVKKKQYSKYTRIINIDIPLNFEGGNGIAHYWPMIISKNGFRAYDNPITVYTNPIFTPPSKYKYGEVLGEVDGVKVYCNGKNNTSMSGEYQCTKFCLRYYEKVYGISFGYGNAKNWFYGIPKLSRYKNGKVRPRPGDILCLDGGAPYQGKTYGHVAIVIDVQDDHIKIAQQNSGTKWKAIGAEIDFNSETNIIANPKGYKTQGVLRPKD